MSPTGGFSAHIAAEIVRTRFEDLSQNVLERSRHAVLDWLAVTIGGASEPSAQIVRSLVRAEGGHPTSSLLGTPARATASQAAFANGVAGHAMDFDDMGLGGHPSVPILSASFALAEELGSNGQDTVTAVNAGYQAMALVGFASGHSAYERGFHTTGTLGIFGAVAACSRLLGLNPSQIQHAIGLAATQAAGLKAAFGTMGKHLNAGRAASNGLLSARLAAAGFIGPTTAIESQQGFAVSHNAPSDHLDLSRASAKLAGRLGVELIYFKTHASCGATASAISSIRSIMATHPFSTEEIERVQLTIPAALLDICGIRSPTSGLESKFSIWYVASLALASRDTGPASFTDSAIRDQSIADLSNRIDVIPLENLAMSQPTSVAIHLRSGEVLRETINANAPVPDSELVSQLEILRSKYRGLASPVLGSSQAEKLLLNVDRLESLGSISELLVASRTRT